MRYDLVVIGSGPAGQKGAIAAAKLGKRAAIIDRSRRQMGGVCLHTGTIPSKTMREAIMHLTGFRHREVYGERYREKHRIKMSDLRRQIAYVLDHELEVVHDQLERNGVDTFSGEARFVGPHELAVENQDGFVRIAVRDHGVGVPEGERERIFDRFYQAQSQGWHGGLGLGLYISRQIVEMHGGSIGVESPPDRGSRFVVMLPVGPELPEVEDG